MQDGRTGRFSAIRFQNVSCDFITRLCNRSERDQSRGPSDRTARDEGSRGDGGSARARRRSAIQQLMGRGREETLHHSHSTARLLHRTRSEKPQLRCQGGTCGSCCQGRFATGGQGAQRPSGPPTCYEGDKMWLSVALFHICMNKYNSRLINIRADQMSHRQARRTKTLNSTIVLKSLWQEKKTCRNFDSSLKYSQTKSLNFSQEL